MRIRGNTVYLPLQKRPNQKRLFALIDLEDYERVSQHKWYAVPSGKTWYAAATSKAVLPQHQQRLHAFIMKAHHGDRFDHINGDGLDNQKANLRPATQPENARNTFKTDSVHVTSKFKGVSRASSGRWISQITFDGSCSVVGLFDDEEEAARAYDKAALRLFGEFAKTNETMGLFEHDKPIRPTASLGRGGVRVTRAVVREAAGLRKLEPWEDFLAGNRPDIDRSIPHRDRRRSAAALARRGLRPRPPSTPVQDGGAQ